MRGRRQIFVLNRSLVLTDLLPAELLPADLVPASPLQNDLLENDLLENERLQNDLSGIFLCCFGAPNSAEFHGTWRRSWTLYSLG